MVPWDPFLDPPLDRDKMCIWDVNAHPDSAVILVTGLQLFNL